MSYRDQMSHMEDSLADTKQRNSHMGQMLERISHQFQSVSLWSIRISSKLNLQRIQNIWTSPNSLDCLIDFCKAFCLVELRNLRKYSVFVLWFRVSALLGHRFNSVSKRKSNFSTLGMFISRSQIAILSSLSLSHHVVF